MNAHTLGAAGLLSLALLSLLAAACGSGAFTTRGGEGDGTERPRGRSERSSTAGGANGTEVGLPSGPVDVSATWQEGDAAFRGRDYETAYQRFSLVYLVDPMFGGGQILPALTETCNVRRADCVLVLGRLDHLRLAYSGQFGPRASWVPQQEDDYTAILECWDQSLAGDYDAAYHAGYPVLNAPLPAFSDSARACVNRVSALQSQANAYQQQQEAITTWDAHFDAFRAAWVELEPAVTREDWDAIVDTYPRYKLAEEPLVEAIDGGQLVADPMRGVQVIEAVEWLTTVRDWEREHGAEYEAMRDAIRALEDDSAHNQALLEYESVYVRLPPLQDEVATLTVARDATSGDDRRNIERRIDATEAEIRDLRRELRRIMGSVNNLRQAHGLPVREAPYGLN